MYRTQNTRTTTTSTPVYRCTDEFKSSSSSNINISKMNSFKIEKSIKKKFEELKKLKDEKDKARLTLSSIPSMSNNKKTKKQRNNANTKYRQKDQEETTLRKQIYRELTTYLKQKAVKRATKLMNSPKDSRFNKIACTVKALFDALGKCPNGLSASSSGSITNFETLIRKFGDLNSKDRELAIAFIKNIFENQTNPIQTLKKLGELRPEFKTSIITLLESLPICN